MSYTINKTDGSVLTTLIDGNIDQVATSLTLVGKSASAYGEYINENFIRLLENFANTTQPGPHPITGQIWYDTVESRLKVYDGSAFKLTGGTIISDNVPSSIAAGDIWIDTARQQLYFNDGMQTILAGPLDPAVTGFKVIQVLDQYGVSHNVLVINVSTTLFAILSSTAFVPDSEVLGYTLPIKVGLNLVNRSSITNVANPVDSYDAVNKLSLVNAVKLATLSISVDISAITGDKNAAIITQYLNKMFPAYEYSVPAVNPGDPTGPRCRVICTDTTSSEQPITIRQFLLDGTWRHEIDL
jgi:hypothetical protein